jgi:hypothetical protein
VEQHAGSKLFDKNQRYQFAFILEGLSFSHGISFIGPNHNRYSLPFAILTGKNESVDTHTFFERYFVDMVGFIKNAITN